MRALSVMTRDVVTITPDDDLQSAHEIMMEWEIRHLPVVEGNALVGILSDRDVIIHSAIGSTGLVVPNIFVADAMTPMPLTCRANASIGFMAGLMLDHKIDSLPIVDDEGLIGLVTSSDLLQLLREQNELGAQHPIPFKFKLHKGSRQMEA